MFEIFRLKKAGYSAVITGSDRSNRYLSNVRCEASRHFRNKKKEYLKDKIDELETNSKIKISNIYRELVTLRRFTNLELI